MTQKSPYLSGKNKRTTSCAEPYISAQRTLLVQLIPSIFLCFWGFLAPAQAEDSVQLTVPGVDLQYSPAAWRALSAPPPALISLESATTAGHSFNLIRLPGRSPYDRANGAVRIAEEYRRVGFVDAVATLANDLTVQQSRVPTWQVQYTVDARPTFAFVSILTGRGSYLIATFISPGPPEQALTAYQSLLSGLSVLDLESSTERSSDALVSDWQPPLLAILILLSILVLRARRAKSSRL